jgi:GAF domain-containing protein
MGAALSAPDPDADQDAEAHPTSFPHLADRIPSLLMRVGPVVPRRAVATEVASLARARSSEDLAATLAPAALALLESDLACVSLDGERSAELSSWGPVDPAFSEYYDRHWRARDPIAQVARVAHEPMHDGAVFEQARWQAEPLFDAVCAPSGLHHYMVVPLLGGGRVVGTLALARSKERRAFRDADRVPTGALAGHASALLAVLRRPAGQVAWRATSERGGSLRRRRP